MNLKSFFIISGLTLIMLPLFMGLALGVMQLSENCNEGNMSSCVILYKIIK